MTIDGHCAESATAIEKLLLPLREKGVEVGAEPLETLVG
jgi:hypothetical protein